MATARIAQIRPDCYALRNCAKRSSAALKISTTTATIVAGLPAGTVTFEVDSNGVARIVGS